MPMTPIRRWSRLHSASVAIATALSCLPSMSQAAPCPDWPLWDAFLNTYVTADARVHDPVLAE